MISHDGHHSNPPGPATSTTGHHGRQHAGEALVTMSFGFLTLLMLSGPSSAMAVGYGVTEWME